MFLAGKAVDVSALKLKTMNICAKMIYGLRGGSLICLTRELQTARCLPRLKDCCLAMWTSQANIMLLRRLLQKFRDFNISFEE